MPDYGFNTQGGTPRDALKFLLDLLEQQQETRVNEANSWRNSLEATGQYIGMASNSDSLGEWDTLMDTWIQQGEEHSALTGDVSYEMLSKVVEKNWDLKKDKINAFESTLADQATLLHSPDTWNIQKFKDPSKGIDAWKEGEEYDQAWIDFETALGDRPIRFSSDTSYEDIQNFINLWQDGTVRGHIPADKSIISIMKNLSISYQNKMTALQNMGVVFDANGNITNIAQLGDIKQTYIVNGSEYNIQDLARDAWKSREIYMNFEDGLTNQNIAVNDFSTYWNPVSERYEMEAGEVGDIRTLPLVTLGEVTNIMNMTNTEFKQHEKDIKKTLRTNLNNANTRLNNLSIREAQFHDIILQMKKNQLNQFETTNLNMTVDEKKQFGIAVGEEIITAQNANNAMTRIVAHKNATLREIQEIYMSAWAYGAHDEFSHLEADPLDDAFSKLDINEGKDKKKVIEKDKLTAPEQATFSITKDDARNYFSEKEILALSQEEWDKLSSEGGTIEISAKKYLGDDYSDFVNRWKKLPYDEKAVPDSFKNFVLEKDVIPVGYPGDEGLPMTEDEKSDWETDLEIVKRHSEEGLSEGELYGKLGYVRRLEEMYEDKWLEHYDDDAGHGEWKLRP